MSKFKWSKISKIYKISLFTFLFILLTLFIVSKESLTFNNKEKKLRKLGAENVCFTIFRIFNYFFIYSFSYPFLLLVHVVKKKKVMNIK